MLRQRTPNKSHLFAAVQPQRHRASSTNLKSLRQHLEPGDNTPTPLNDTPTSTNDFILSILRANPSLRDTKLFLASFNPRTNSKSKQTTHRVNGVSLPITDHSEKPQPQPLAVQSPLVASILDPVHRRTALVKVQGPFTDVQLDSIARGLVYLEMLGLVCVIVCENDALLRGDEGERQAVIEDTMRMVSALEKYGAKARPLLDPVVRLGPMPNDKGSLSDDIPTLPEAHVRSGDLVGIRSSVRAGETPVIPPFALDSFCRSVRINANDVIAALARGMVEAAALDGYSTEHNHEGQRDLLGNVDLTPLRLMIINRTGGVPSYARSGYPHLLINLTSEYSHICDTFQESWREINPAALSNLSLARTCLAYMPPTSSAIMVSHRSPSELIANLITNRPAVSSSLPHALLQGNRKLTQHTPTLLRRGLPIQVLRTMDQVDRAKMKTLLEQAFGKKMNEEPFYRRLEHYLDFVIVAGDYAGAAIVTNEPCPESSSCISYLDKFAVLPSHQGDGTVDFLWVALHDESYGLGLPFSVNPNGGKQGQGDGRDLVWRSRSNNPINKWYFERSSGHVRIGSWILFWCDAEKRLKVEEGQCGSAGLSFVEDREQGRLSTWAEAVKKIPSTWV